MHLHDVVQSIHPNYDICTEDVACGESHSASSCIDGSDTLIEVNICTKADGSPKQEML
jgi:ribosomal protein L31